jgi:hypothetical protein
MEIKIGMTNWDNLREIQGTIRRRSGHKGQIAMCKKMEAQLMAGLASAIEAEWNRTSMVDGRIAPDTPVVVTIDLNVRPYGLIEY